MLSARSDEFICRCYMIIEIIKKIVLVSSQDMQMLYVENGTVDISNIKT